MTAELIIGIILILINVPFGLGGAFICGYYGKKTGKKFFYFLSVVVYAFSWGMLAAGVWLCGRPYAEYIIENYVKKYIVPTVIVSLIFAIIFLFVYRKKIFKNHKNDKTY